MSDDERRYWRGSNGGATYLVVAPNAMEAMLAILNTERSHGCTDDITELEVEEMTVEEATKRKIRGDSEPDVPFLELPVGEVACSEWP